MKRDSDLRIGLRDNSEALPTSVELHSAVRVYVPSTRSMPVAQWGPAGSQALASGAAAPRLGGAKHMSKRSGCGETSERRPASVAWGTEHRYRDPTSAESSLNILALDSILGRFDCIDEYRK